MIYCINILFGSLALWWFQIRFFLFIKLFFVLPYVFGIMGDHHSIPPTRESTSACRFQTHSYVCNVRSFETFSTYLKKLHVTLKEKPEYVDIRNKKIGTKEFWLVCNLFHIFNLIVSSATTMERWEEFTYPL